MTEAGEPSLSSNSKKRSYEKPHLASHQVFEASLACMGLPGSLACGPVIRRTKS